MLDGTTLGLGVRVSELEKKIDTLSADFKQTKEMMIELLQMLADLRRTTSRGGWMINVQNKADDVAEKLRKIGKKVFCNC